MDLDWIRSFLAILEEGSMNAAAERLGVAQSSLTRRVQALEQELGGALLERTTRGVAPTAAGQALARSMTKVVQDFDAGWQSTRELLRGKTEHFRVGYLLSAATSLVNPALGILRRAHPAVRIELHDLSPGEQIEALRSGEIDFGLMGQVSGALEKEFHLRTVARMGVVVAMAEDHPLAVREDCTLADLKDGAFIGVPENDVPGFRQWATTLCRRGGFKPRFRHEADSLSMGLSQVIVDNTFHLLGAYAASQVVPGIRFLPVSDAPDDWELTVAWPPGRTSTVVNSMIEALRSVAVARST